MCENIRVPPLGLGGSKVTYLQKSVFRSAFGFSNIAFLFLHTLLLCHILLFGCWIFFNTIQMSKSLDPDQAQHFVWPDLGPKCLQRLSADIAGKELNTKQLADTFWLKPWLKLISFG